MTRNYNKNTNNCNVNLACLKSTDTEEPVGIRSTILVGKVIQVSGQLWSSWLSHGSKKTNYSFLCIFGGLRKCEGSEKTGGTAVKSCKKRTGCHLLSECPAQKSSAGLQNRSWEESGCGVLIWDELKEDTGGAFEAFLFFHTNQTPLFTHIHTQNQKKSHHQQHIININTILKKGEHTHLYICSFFCMVTAAPLQLLQSTVQVPQKNQSHVHLAVHWNSKASNLLHGSFFNLLSLFLCLFFVVLSVETNSQRELSSPLYTLMTIPLPSVRLSICPPPISTQTLIDIPGLPP